MNTRIRAEALARTLAGCSSIIPTTPNDLLALVRAELGHEMALDEFVQHGSQYTRATPLRTILHVIAGNTPAAGLQSLVRGLLLGSDNLAKLPSEGLPELEDFIARLDPALAAKVSSSRELTPSWLDRADAVIVFGSDAAIAEIRKQTRPDQLFVGHGHRVSFGVVFDDPRFESVSAAARDVAAFDQLGCLSPHVFYVAGNARSYAESLSAELAQLESTNPRGAVPLSVSNAIRGLREDVQFRTANGESCAIWGSENSTAWTVIYEEADGFPSSPLHRTIFVKPFTAALADELGPLRSHLSCAGLHPLNAANADQLATLGVSRICALGRMQQPPWTWHQDGLPTLSNLVRWVDIEFAG